MAYAIAAADRPSRPPQAAQRRRTEAEEMRSSCVRNAWVHRQTPVSDPPPGRAGSRSEWNAVVEAKSGADPAARSPATKGQDACLVLLIASERLNQPTATMLGKWLHSRLSVPHGPHAARRHFQNICALSAPAALSYGYSQRQSRPCCSRATTSPSRPTRKGKKRRVRSPRSRPWCRSRLIFSLPTS